MYLDVWFCWSFIRIQQSHRFHLNQCIKCQQLLILLQVIRQMIRLCRALTSRFSQQTNSRKSIIQLFKDRKLYYQSNSLHLQSEDFFAQNHGKAVYCGYDPTSSSLHLGNLVSILMLARLNAHGMRPIFLVGGATGLIGDPSGKNKERQLLQVQSVHHNISCLQREISTIYSTISSNLLKNPQKYLLSAIQQSYLRSHTHQIINNYSFYQDINFIQFLRNIGKNFRMGPLLSKQMVSKRLQSQDGLSFAEFSYSLMQAYDYSQLFENKNCVLQIGGSDQWGNILNGAELVKKKLKKQAYAITMPLLLTKSGAKFGKSQGNALFLNQQKTPLKQIYQYFYNTADEDLQKYLSIFTFFSEQQIKQIINEHQSAKQKRKGQQILASEAVALLGQYEHLDKDLFTLSHQQLFSKSVQYVQKLYQHKKSTQPYSFVKISQQKIRQMQQIADLFLEAGAAKSKKEVRRQIQAGGVYVNNQRINKQDSERVPTQKLEQELRKRMLHEKYLILRWGKKKYYFAEVV